MRVRTVFGLQLLMFLLSEKFVVVVVYECFPRIIYKDVVVLPVLHYYENRTRRSGVTKRRMSVKVNVNKARIHGNNENHKQYNASNILRSADVGNKMK